MKIEKLTKEQEEIVEKVKDKWLNRFFSCKYLFDEKQFKESIAWLYSLMDLDAPDVIVVDDPPEAQKTANKLCGTKNQIYDFCYYGGVGDCSWVAFYDAFRELGVVKNEKFNEFVKLIECNFFTMIQFDDTVIVVKLPNVIKRDSSNRLHCESGPAVVFGNNSYKCYYYHGIEVDERIIEHPETITVDEIRKEKNAEHRRVLMEIYGHERFIKDSKAKAIRSEKPWGELFEIDPKDGNEKIYYLSFLNSTPEKDGSFRKYFHRISPEIAENKELTVKQMIGKTFPIFDVLQTQYDPVYMS